MVKTETACKGPPLSEERQGVTDGLWIWEADFVLYEVPWNHQLFSKQKI